MTRVRIIRPCSKFAYPVGYEFELDEVRAGKWIDLGYMVAMGATPKPLPEKPQEQQGYTTANMKRNKRR